MSVVRSIKKTLVNNLDPQFTFTSGGGPGVGFKLKRLPIAFDMDPTGPGAGVVVSTDTISKWMNRIPSKRAKRYARTVKKTPGSVYAGLEWAGILPIPFVGGSIALSDKDKLINMFKKKEKKQDDKKNNKKKVAKMNKQAYRQGFNEACKYYDIEPEQVLAFTKQAGIWSEDPEKEHGTADQRKYRARRRSTVNVLATILGAGLGASTGGRIGQGPGALTGAVLGGGLGLGMSKIRNMLGRYNNLDALSFNVTNNE